MKTGIFLITLLSALSLSCSVNTPVQKIDLSGEWKFAMDRNDEGISGEWYKTALAGKVMLPGSMTSNGKGDDITLQTPWTGQIIDSSYFKKPEYARYREPGNIKIPFWLQPLKYYKGAAWYQKKVIIPRSWKNQDIRLFLERCHWESRLWVDDQYIDMRNSLGTPHTFDLTGYLTPGKHILTLCVDNRTKEIDPGINSHSISDHTQTNWNGITGKICLEAHPLTYIRNVQVYPDIHNRKITVRVHTVNLTGNPVKIDLELKVSGASEPEPQKGNYDLSPGENILTIDYPMGDSIRLWNEFHPDLCFLSAIMTNPARGTTDTCRTIFGMREIKAENGLIKVNDIPVFLRGTLECAIFPKTGYPPTDVNEWLRIFNICRAHGLNHMRFHSWCPPEAAFEAADRTGFYLQVECSSWANQSTTLGDGKPFDQYLYEESKRMAEAYGNHPSFCMMAYGNEPRGRNQAAFLTEFVTFWKQADPRRIYTSGAGWPNLPVNDYLSDSEPRIQHWGQGLGSIINARPPATDFDWRDYTGKFSQPMVGHEIGQWCVYPDFKEIRKYDGVVRANNFEIFKESLKKNGMEQLADSFLLASGKLQSLCYKADIEAALRTPKFGGFQLLDLHDFPGQGTALVGILNPFWEEKGYITPAEFSRFCHSTVPLIRMKKRILTSEETFEAAVEVAHYGETPLTNCTPEWKVTDAAGNVLLRGKLPSTDIPVGNAYPLGKISFPAGSFPSPCHLMLEVNVDLFSNSWDFWVYPIKYPPVQGSEKIKIAQQFNDDTRHFLEEGGIVLLTLKKGSLKPGVGGVVETGFSSIFWNTAWTSGQAPHTLGILCNPGHPALADFPTEYHSNWQWWDAMSHSEAIILTGLPPDLKPIVRVIDDWFTNRPLALLFEARMGKGRILVSGIDLTTSVNGRPEARQLLHSLIKYMAGPRFEPGIELKPENISVLLK